MLVDIGANLTHAAFAPDLAAVLARAERSGVCRMVVTGASMEGSEQAAALAASHRQLYATAGIHPHHAGETDAASIERLRELTRHDKVLAVGETGLDFYRNFSPRPTQVASFEQHIELAVSTGLPLFLHERDAHPALAEMMSSARDTISRAVVHCFTGRKDALYAYLDLDCYIGITGWICDERRGAHLLELVRAIPRNRLLLETDAPYLLPRGLRPKPKTRRNEPHYLTVVCQAVADCLAISPAELARATAANAREFFASSLGLAES